jgi:hypothetical protein
MKGSIAVSRRTPPTASPNRLGVIYPYILGNYGEATEVEQKRRYLSLVNNDKEIWHIKERTYDMSFVYISDASARVISIRGVNKRSIFERTFYETFTALPLKTGTRRRPPKDVYVRVYQEEHPRRGSRTYPEGRDKRHASRMEDERHCSVPTPTF